MPGAGSVHHINNGLVHRTKVAEASTDSSFEMYVRRCQVTAERTFKAVKQEAAAQGLTPQAARAGAAAVGAKLKTVAKTARDQTAKAKST